jgi:hypothetical protein
MALSGKFMGVDITLKNLLELTPVKGQGGLLGVFLHSVLLAFSQSYIKHDLRKNKIVVPFFCQQINFYELIVRS